MKSYSNDKICYIFGAGPISLPLKFLPSPKKDFVIAADAGYKTLSKCGLKPDLLVGDLDSLGSAPDDVELVRFPTIKDDTDMMLAFKEGMKHGYTNFIIYGGLGGRIEFTLANMQILYNVVNSGCRCFFVGENCLVTATRNGKFRFNSSFNGRISVFAGNNDAFGVTISGLKYTLDNGVLHYDNPLGVSNEFIGKSGEISVENGIICVVYDDCNNLLYCE